MDYLLSPTLLSIAVIVGLFCLMVVLLDVRRTQHTKQLRQLMQSFVTSHAMQSFTIIVELGQSIDQIKNLIKHLETHGYVDIQLLVLVKNTKRAADIGWMRRFNRNKHSNLRVSVVRRQSGKDERRLISRYAKNDVLMWLLPDERLSRNFFKYVSLELLDESRSAVAPRLTLRVNETLRSAMAALNSVAEQTVKVALAKTPATGSIIRKTAYKAESRLNIVRSEHAIISSEAVQRPSGKLASIALIIILVVGLVAATLNPTGSQFVTATAVGAVVLLLALRLLSYPYTALTMTSILLLLPFWPVIEGLPYLLDRIVRAFGTAARSRHRIIRKSDA